LTPRARAGGGKRAVGEAIVALAVAGSRRATMSWKSSIRSIT
jgi:hypothetical protein